MALMGRNASTPAGRGTAGSTPARCALTHNVNCTPISRTSAAAAHCTARLAFRTRGSRMSTPHGSVSATWGGTTLTGVKGGLSAFSFQLPFPLLPFAGADRGRRSVMRSAGSGELTAAPMG